jgi:predicted transcriptional regulator
VDRKRIVVMTKKQKPVAGTITVREVKAATIPERWQKHFGVSADETVEVYEYHRPKTTGR